jgi:hypothetical protein
VALAERWDGTQWSVQAAAPGSARGDALRGVSCPTATFCVAVGSGLARPGTKVLVEQWAGSGWSIQQTPTRGLPPRRRDHLRDVSCVSASACVAVGGGIVERWDGASWSLALKVKATAGFFTAVACSSARACVTVAAGHQPFWARWNGRKWAVRPMPFSDPIGDPNSAVYSSISCTTTTDCVAAGSYFNDTVGAYPVALRLSGSTWSNPARFRIPHYYEPPPGFLGGISCTPGGGCTAVGSLGGTLALHWSGRTWSTQPTANIAPAPTRLNAVSCSSASACVAVGYYNDVDGLHPLAESWNGTSWSIQTTPDGPHARNHGGSQLNSVSCISANACIAVGESASLPLAERWDGTRWTLLKPILKTIDDGAFNGVSCTVADACTAVGGAGLRPADDATVALAERWDGTQWTVQTVPDPAGNAAGAINQFAAVSCSSATACIATGTHAQVANGIFEPMAQGWDGSSWSIENTPALNTPALPEESANLDSVSCTSASACIAVAFGHAAEQWDGTHWTLQSLPPDLVGEGAFAAVSCTSPLACTAVGFGASPVADFWNGTIWSPDSLPIPPGDSGSLAELNGVSCTSATACTAVGTRLTGSGEPGSPIAIRSS